MVATIVGLLLFAGLVVLVAHLLPGIQLKDFPTAVMVAVVYTVLHWLFYLLFSWLALPFMILTLGLATLVINTVLLWATDQLLDSFEIKDVKTTFVAAILLTIGKLLIDLIL